MPPTTLRPDLSPEDVDRVNSIRTQMWKRGAQGFFLGGLMGWYGCRSLMKFQHRHPTHTLAKALPTIAKKHVVMWTLLDAVLLSYVAVAREGKTGMAAVQDIKKKELEDKAKTETSFEFKQEEQLDERIPQRVREVVEEKRRIAKASEDSHARRLEAIEAKKRQRDRDW